MKNLKGKATDKQISYLKRHGIDATLFSKQDASDMISDLIEDSQCGMSNHGYQEGEYEHYSQGRSYEDDMGYPLDFGDLC